MSIINVVIGPSQKTAEVNDEENTIKTIETKKFIPIGKFFGQMSKGASRQVRKSLYKAGFVFMAATKREGK